MIIVIEPHADDAYLSLGAHIEEWTSSGESVGIFTVYSGTRRRAEDAQRFAAAVGATWAGLGLMESSPADDEVVELPPAVEWPSAETLIFPLGLKHPEHRAIAALAPVEALFYVETPYQLVTANGDELASRVNGRTIWSWRRPPARKWRHHGLFKDQAMFMRYNPPSRLANAPEVIVR